VVAYPGSTKIPQQLFAYALAASSGGHEYQIVGNLQVAQSRLAPAALRG